MADQTRVTVAQKRKRKNTPQKLVKISDSTDSEKETEAKKAKTAPQDVKDEIRDKFKMEMPQDFYDFWEFCKTLDTDKPECALIDTLDLELVGPYDVLTGKFKDINKSSVISYHLHWRHYYDPPEFQTVIRACNSDQGYHIGYFRDDPKSLPVFLASNQANVSCEMTIMGENLFSAVSIYLAEVLKKCKDKTKQNTLKKLQSSLMTKAKELEYNLSPTTPDIKARNKKSNSKTFHKAGMVVPVDASEVGYRPLTVTDGELKKILKKISEGKDEKEREEASEELQEILTYVQFANDECDYGMGLELGLDIFCFGEKRFHNTILQLMPLAYRLLGRDLFAEISEIHIEHRDRKELSQVPAKK